MTVSALPVGFDGNLYYKVYACLYVHRDVYGYIMAERNSWAAGKAQEMTPVS
jgi:hypothetical protein